VLARAVRKAVISSALRRALGLPLLSKSVRLPFGVVVCELAIDCGGSKVDVDDMDCSDRDRVSSDEAKEGDFEGFC
jgi:hypothetical protein